MAMGQSRDEYWNGYIFASYDYAEAHRIKQKEANETAWLHGLYVYDAFASIMSSMFSKAGDRGKQYSEKPYDIYEDDTVEAKQKQEDVEKLQANIWMQRFCEYGKNWGKQ